MRIEKVAEGAYFVPSYSEQTIAWSPLGFTIQGLAVEEIEATEPVLTRKDEHFTKEDSDRDLRRVSRKVKRVE